MRAARKKISGERGRLPTWGRKLENPVGPKARTPKSPSEKVYRPSLRISMNVGTGMRADWGGREGGPSFTFL